MGPRRGRFRLPLVERQAPDPEEGKARELKDYLDEVGEQELPEMDEVAPEDVEAAEEGEPSETVESPLDGGIEAREEDPTEADVAPSDEEADEAEDTQGPPDTDTRGEA